MLSIRPLDSEHIPKCLEILNLNYAAPWKELDTIFHTATNSIYGAFIETTLIGFIVISTVFDESEILMCIVNPEHHKQGVASTLLDYSLDCLNKRRNSAVFLEVDTHNLPAIALYKKFAFQSIGFRKAYYLQPDGSYNDAIIMRRDA